MFSLPAKKRGVGHVYIAGLQCHSGLCTHHLPWAVSLLGDTSVGGAGWAAANSFHLGISVSRVKPAHTPKTTRIRRDCKNFYHRMESRSWGGNSRSYDGLGWKVASYRLFMLSEHQQNSEADALKPIATSPLTAVGKVELQTFTLFSKYFF